MSWNYRIIRELDDSTSSKKEKTYFYKIAEVYYDDEGNIDGWCSSEGALEWCELESLIETIKLLQGVIDKPVLEVNGDTLIEVKN